MRNSLKSLNFAEIRLFGKTHPKMVKKLLLLQGIFTPVRKSATFAISSIFCEIVDSCDFHKNIFLPKMVKQFFRAPSQNSAHGNVLGPFSGEILLDFAKTHFFAEIHFFAKIADFREKAAFHQKIGF